jgi:spore germination cell wall hydrolase CwlJ-like protein
MEESVEHRDYFMLALCLWREARGEGPDGMTAVGCVVRNRVVRNVSSYYEEVVKPLQFSSITAPGDHQLCLYSHENDHSWQVAEEIARKIIDREIGDLTAGATLYWNPAGIAEKDSKPYTLKDGSIVRFPGSWNPHAVLQTVRIGAHIFLREV